MDEQVWKSVIGCEGYYEISNYGNIRSVDRIVLRRGIVDKYIKIKGKNLKWAINNHGYQYLYLSNGVKNNFFIYAHRAVANCFIFNESNKREVNHRDGNKLNNHYLNLEWATRAENVHHAIIMGLNDSRGEKCGKSKLKDYQVLEIRESFDKKFGWYSQTARKYGVAPSTINDVIKRSTFKHI